MNELIKVKEKRASKKEENKKKESKKWKINKKSEEMAQKSKNYHNLIQATRDLFISYTHPQLIPSLKTTPPSTHQNEREKKKRKEKNCYQKNDRGEGGQNREVGKRTKIGWAKVVKAPYILSL